jgi:hypothetical protein
MDDLLSDEPGWGNWPNDVGEAIYISIILRIWLGDAVALEKPGLSKQELDRLGESVIERIVQRKDGQEPTLQDFMPQANRYSVCCRSTFGQQQSG